MDLHGPLAVSPLKLDTTSGIGLRLFQRITAEVVSVTGKTVLLTLEGHSVVAQLTSTNQATNLLSQRTAQFIVTKISDKAITLKLIRHDPLQPSKAGSPLPGPELAVRLLEQNNIPVTDKNLIVAHSVLNRQLPLTPGLLNELLNALSAYGPWGKSQADLAAALKHAGLPVTAQSLALADHQAAQIGEALGQVIAQLQTARENLPPELLKKIYENVQMLEELVLDAGEDPVHLAKGIKTAIDILGRSLESVLLEQAQNPENISAERALLSLVKLQQELVQAGETGLAGHVKKFLGDLSHHQFFNVKPEPDLGLDNWSEIGFRLRGERFSAARLRIRREPPSNPTEIDPAYTRLLLQVDIGEDEIVELDLTMAGKQIRMQVTAPDSAWCQQAEKELPSFEKALLKLGYNPKETQISLSDPQLFEALRLAPSGAPLMTVNIEV